MRLYFCLRSAARVQYNFVPLHKPARSTDVRLVEDFVNQARKLLVITGAGLSTESGIPDYRSEGVGLYARTDRRPIQYNEFFRKESARQRYWARNYVGWPLFSSFRPNESHEALSEWEKLGKIHWLVTQNVDALHHKAGSSRVTELHGCSHRVTCLDCKMMMPRDELQAMFHLANPSWFAESDEIAPDADVQLTDEQVAGFQVPPCPSCGGRLKPDVIFFGDNVPRPKVDFVFGMVDECDRILVCGSSLHVYSAYRFVDRAYKQKKKIAVLNIGDTRADKIINAKISARCGEVLPSVNIQTRKS